MRLRATLTLLAMSQLAFAGGAWERVKIESLRRSGDTEYVLVVRPEPAQSGYVDPYMGRCKVFTVHGEYARLRRAWIRNPDYVSRDSHLAALEFLEKAATKQTTILLGWVGSGFVPLRESDPCEVRSRALVLEKDSSTPVVLSFHDMV